MSAPWRETTIGALAAGGHLRLQTGPFGSQLHAHDYVTSGIPVIPTEAIGRRVLRTEGLPQVDDATAARLARHRVQPGDILFARRGVQATGYSALVQAQHADWICGTGAILLRLTSHEIDPVFLSFVLAAEDSIEWLKAHAVGAVMPNLNTEVISRLPIFLPPLAEQRGIAAVLGALDAKIDLNRRTNETLEDLATGFFRSLLAGLDPQRLPPGWTVRPIGDCVIAVGGSTPSTSEPMYWGDDVPFATPKDMSALETPLLLGTERHITGAGLARISSGLLPAGTVLLSSRAPIGYLAITEVPVAVNQGIIAMRCEGPLPNYYVLHWARENMSTIIGSANGTTFLEISKRNFRPLPVIVPPPDVLVEFTASVAPLYRLISSHVRESVSFATLRDTLLPRLLSGELRVRDAEPLVAAAV